MTLPLISFAVAFLIGFIRSPEEDGFWNRATSGFLTGLVVAVVLSAVVFALSGGGAGDVSDYNTRP